MKLVQPRLRTAALVLCFSLLCTLSFPSAALFGRKKAPDTYVLDFAKNGMIGTTITFSPEDFMVNREDSEALQNITLRSLPDPKAGILSIGGVPLQPGAVLERSALSGLQFQSMPSPAVTTTQFTFTSSFSDHPGKEETTVTLYLLEQENHPPIARNMELSTYKNIAVTGCLDAVDKEGERLSYRITSTPARGSVSLSEDGSGMFVYTPYENKTGRDSFTFVAQDGAGNVSPEARVVVRISKPDTAVTYDDLQGHPAHKAAIHLAESGVYVGACVNGRYFFSPDQPVSRAQFLTMAMAATKTDPMSGVTLTGFHDDEAIPTWAKGSVSAALKAGVIRGSRDEYGAPVFQANQTITRGEATVMLNRLLNITDVPVEVFSSGTEDHWAAQAAANLSASGILTAEETNHTALSSSLSLAQAAELLDGAMEVLDLRKPGLF